jgi:hypothetical protein
MPENYTGDGRKIFDDLNKTFERLVSAPFHFIREPICLSRGFPIISYRTRKEGKALWLIAGIHGEEPAGPNAFAEGIDIIQKLGEKYPLVVLPLCNPSGYDRNWRYLNRKDYQDHVVRLSTGDPEHHMIGDIRRKRTITSEPTSPEAGKLIDHIIELTKTHPPVVSIDFHEDDILPGGYVYSQGRYEERDPLAKEVLDILAKTIPIKRDGKSSNNETIKDGLVGAVCDISIDHFLSEKQIIVDGEIVPGPAARTVLVTELPSSVLPLEKRVDAYLSVLKHLTTADLGM